MTPTADFLIENAGSVWMFTPLNDVAVEWTDENLKIEDWQWLGESFGVEHRIGWQLQAILADHGFSLQFQYA